MNWNYEESITYGSYLKRKQNFDFYINTLQQKSYEKCHTLARVCNQKLKYLKDQILN